MSLWSSIVYKLGEIIKNMIGANTIEKTLNISPVISAQMENAIQLWSDMYKNQSPWLNEPSPAKPARVTSLGLASMIASEKARIALLEFESDITAPAEEVEVDNPNYKRPKPDSYGYMQPIFEPPVIIEERIIGNKERAEYLNDQYKKLKNQLRKQLEYGIAKGGLVIKPYVVLKNISSESGEESNEQQADIEFDFVQADAFYPVSFDSSGKIIEAAFIQTKIEGNIIYRRLEYHKWYNNTVEIINKAYKSTNNTTSETNGVDLGQEVPLAEVLEWKDFPSNTIIKNVERPLFAYFKMPDANTIDTNSPLGVSGYSRAVNLIKDADMQYSRLLWEYEGGELAVNIDRDAFKFMETPEGAYHTVLGTMQERLYRRVDIGDDELFEPYAPALRDISYIRGLNTILTRIEDVCGISRGTLSDGMNIVEARTATELKILKQRSYQTNADIQQAIEDALRDAVYIMNTYCTLYEITPDGEYDISFEWDDSIITDEEEELSKRIALMQNGIASKLEVRMWYFGETERQAMEALQKIESENMETMQQETMIQANQMAMQQQNVQQNKGKMEEIKNEI